jgi:hypothetical protein
VVPQRWRWAAVAYFYSFHLITFATITISFAPHLAAMTSFLSLEKVRPIVWARRLLQAGTPQKASQTRMTESPANPSTGSKSLS